MVVDVRFYLSLTSYKHLSAAAESQGEQQKCVLIRGVSMLWLIGVMVGLDLRRGISDHTLLCMFVCADQSSRARPSPAVSMLARRQEAMVFFLDASNLGVLGAEGSELKCQRQRELLLLCEKDFTSVSGCWILQLQGYGV